MVLTVFKTSFLAAEGNLLNSLSNPEAAYTISSAYVLANAGIDKTPANALAPDPFNLLYRSSM